MIINCKSGKKYALSMICTLLLFVNANVSDCFADETGEYIHYSLGIKYKDELRYDDAVEEFRKVLALYPDNYNAYMHLAEIRMTQGQNNLAVYNLKKALQYNPGWNKAHKMLAEAYELDGQFQNAVGEIQLYMQLCDPAERDSLQKVINRIMSKTAVSKTGTNNAQVNKTAEKKIKENSIQGKAAVSKKQEPVSTGNPEIDIEFGDAVKLYEQKKYDEALEKLKAVLRAKPGFSGVFYYAGLIRRETGQNKMAKVNLLKGAAYPVGGYNAYLHLGKILAQEYNYTEAISYLNKFVDAAPTESEKKIGRDLIEEYRKSTGSHGSEDIKSETAPAADVQEMDTDSRVIPQEKYMSSIEIQIDSLLSMMTVDTLTDAGQRLLTGIREFKKSNYDQSIREFKRTLAANPTGTAALNCIYNTGVCYYKLHLFREAENQFQQVIEKFPDHPAAPQSLFLKACTYLERGDYGVAETILRKFLQLNKDHRWSGLAYEKLGDAYLEMNQEKKSLDAYQQAILKSQTNYSDLVRIHFKTGSVFSEIGNSVRAIESFNSAIDIGEKQSLFMRVPDAYYRVADEKYKTKDYKGALADYQKVTRKYPSFQETPWGMFQIGTIYKNLKDYQNAVTTFKALIREYPEDYWAKQAQWKLDDAIWENEYQAVLK